MDYYQTLGVNKTASEEDLKKAYRRLAHQYHPDKKGGDEKKFKEINEAYQVLGNKEKRAQYDQFGRVFEQGQQGFNGQGGQGFDFSGGFDMGDLGEIFEDFFGFQRKRRGKIRGENIEIGIDLNLEDVLAGVEQKINLDKMIVCQRCQGKGGEPGTDVKECVACRGTGQVQKIKRTMFGSVSQMGVCPECQGEGKMPENPCNVCKGEGRAEEFEEFKVFIPAGIDSGQKLKLEGKGEAGQKGGPPGDLYLRIFVKPHKVFQRRGDDLFAILPINFSEMVLGSEVELSTLDKKKLSLKIPSGSEPGKVLRISGKGLPHFHSSGKGDLYVEMALQTPKKLSKRQKELLEQMRREGL